MAEEIQVVQEQEQEDIIIEHRSLRPRTKRWLRVGAVAAVSFLAGVAAVNVLSSDQVPSSPSAAEPDALKDEAISKIQQENENQELARVHLLEGLAVKNKSFPVFFGRVEVSFPGEEEPSWIIPNPILFNDVDVFQTATGSAGSKVGQEKMDYFDGKLYGVYDVSSNDNQTFDKGPRLGVHAYMTDQDYTLKFFDTDGNQVEPPNSLLPDDESPFMDHVLYTNDIRIGTENHLEGGRVSFLYLHDGTRVSYGLQD